MNATPKIERFLAKPNICVLATTGPGNSPHAMPMWYLYDDGVILFSTARGSQKHRNVERTGKATVVIDERTPPYYAVMIRGRAEIGPPLAREQELRMAIRYLGKKGGEAYMKDFIEQYGGGGVSIRVHPDKYIEYSDD